jgi:hypothetical protein
MIITCCNVQFFLYVTTRYRNGGGVGAGKDSARRALVSPKTERKRCRHDNEPERIAWHRDHDSAIHSTLRGIKITTAPEHVACSQNHDAGVF